MMKITILIPVYNEEKWLKQTLDSLSNQTYQGFNVIIADNHSTDNSPEICRTFIDGRKDAKYFYHDKNYGAIYNGKFLLKHAKSEYLLFLGAHDILDPKFLELHVGFLKNNPEYVLSYADVRHIDEKNEIITIFKLKSFNHLNKIENNLLRYYHVAASIPDGTEFCHVIRTNVIKNANISCIPGIDQVLIARTAFYGLWKKHSNEIMFSRRMFNTREQHYMERITGIMNVHNSPFPMIKYMVKECWRLSSDTDSWLYRLFLSIILFFRLVIKIYYRKLYFFLTGILKKILPSKLFYILKKKYGFYQ